MSEDRGLRELVAKWRNPKYWREFYARPKTEGSCIDNTRPDAYQCADELEAVLAAHPAGPSGTSEKELLRHMAKAMYAVHRRLEFYTEREVNSPSNHQEFAQEAQEELDAFNVALTMYNEWAKSTEAPQQLPAGRDEVGERVLAMLRECATVLDLRTPATREEIQDVQSRALKVIKAADTPTRSAAQSGERVRQCAKCGAYEESGGVVKHQCVNCGAWLSVATAQAMTASEQSWWQESWSKWQPRILLHGIQFTEEGDPIISNIAGLMTLSEAHKGVWEFQFDNGEWLCVRL